MIRLILTFFVCVQFASVVDAHKLIEPGLQEKIAKGTFSATPTTTWNRLSDKEGKFQEIWTADGDKLNRIIFFGGVPDGEPLLKERHKKRDPLPKVSKNMLLPDIPVLFERTYRTYYGTPIMEIGKQEPATFAGMDGINFEYRYVDANDEVERKGEAYAALVEGRLYVITYEAPTLYYFEKDLPIYRKLVESVTLRD